MTLSGFGHRPDEVGGYSVDTMARLTLFAIETIPQFNPTKIISGMDLGWPQALAFAAVELGIPFVAVLPFSNMENRWPERTQYFYRTLLGKASAVRKLSDGIFKPVKFVARDRWIIDRSEGVLLLWKNKEEYKSLTITDDEVDTPMNVALEFDGTISTVSTRNTDRVLHSVLEYAEEKDRHIYDLWPMWDQWGSEINFEDFRDMLMGMCVDEG